jgi:aspartate aminotransferase-like enzyme
VKGKSDKLKHMSNLRIPGPTPIPPEVLKVLSNQMINHRGHAYEEIQKRVIENLKYFFQTKNDIFLLTSSGMGGLEAAIANFFSPGDTILSFTTGEFGQRWAEVARRYAANIIEVRSPLGSPVDPGKVAELLNIEKNIKGVFVTHNETAVGVLNPVAEIAKLVKKNPAKPLLLIDSISALGSVDLPMDKTNIDVLISASQKAWMAPPGISMIAVSKLAWERHKTAKMPRYYFDLSMFKEFAEKNQTPATPAVTTIYGLDSSLQLMKREGRENIFKRHLKLRDHLRAGIKKMGLKLFVDDKYASPTVTSIIIPDGVDGKKWLEILRDKYNVVLAGGMGSTKGKIIRVAHMGWVSEKDVDDVLTVLKKSFLEIKS